MSNLTCFDSTTSIQNSSALQKNPFQVIFTEALDSHYLQSLSDRAEFLVELGKGIHELEIGTESTSAKNHWLSIISGFGAALTIAGSVAIVPPFGLLFSGLSIVSAAATIYESVNHNQLTNSLIETLKKHRLVLESQEAIQWATLWLYADVNIFCSALKVASSGHISDDKILHRNGDTPFSVAIAYVANCQGVGYESLITKLSALKNDQSNPVLAQESVRQDVNTIGSNTRLKAITVTASKIPDALPTNKIELLARLKAECPEILKLLKSQPIRVVGTQRTGKTTIVKKLALLRLLLLPNHKVIASTPHYEPENPYPSVFEVVGVQAGKRDYAAIKKQWDAMAIRIENCERNSITTVWDEFGLFNQVMQEEKLTSVLTSTVREATKHGEYPVFIVPGETQAFLPGSEEGVTIFLNSTVRVETIGEVVTGADGLDEMRPTGNFRVTWLDGSREVGQIPQWLTEEFLISLISGSIMMTNQTRDTQEKLTYASSQNDSLSISESPVEQLNKIFKSEAFTPSYEGKILESVQTSTNKFVEFAESLNHESQTKLKLFVLWLDRKQGEEISLKQIEDDWAKKKGISRRKDSLLPLIQIAVFKKLLTALPNNNYLVADLRKGQLPN